MSQLTPREIVSELDKFIIGQSDAKRAVAIALRNRWRRMQLDNDLSNEVKPKNILMIGPTGVGKTEIARRLSILANAPFIKVEATKFTEVGYVGRDVESIIRDLIDVAIKKVRADELKRVQIEAEDQAEAEVLNILLPGANDTPDEGNPTRQKFRKKLREGDLDDKEIEVELDSLQTKINIMGMPGMEDMISQLQNAVSGVNKKSVKRKMTIKKALKEITKDKAALLIDEDKITKIALEQTEQNGIVFIDEIDKVAQDNNNSRGSVSREGVQRDLLPLIDGSTVTTKHGSVVTDHILFIASGAFHLSKPSDLIPELQGRLPIRVGLDALTVDDFMRILTEPNASLTEQYIGLLKTEGINLNFTDESIRKISEISWQVNEKIENIGARRLSTVMERLLEAISFEACDLADKQVTIDVDYVLEHLGELAENEDLSRYVL